MVVVCGNVLGNDSMKPSHLKHHLTTKHTVLKDKPVYFFSLRKLVSEAVKVHGVSLGQQLRKYVSVTAKENNWMRNSLSIGSSEMPEDFTVGELESLTELSCNKTFKRLLSERGRCWTFENNNAANSHCFQTFIL